MRTHHACIPCFVRQTLESARLTTDDEAVHERVLRRVLAELAAADWGRSPPDLSRDVHAAIREECGVADPYAELKRTYNHLALGMYPELRRRVDAADDPLAMALQLVMAANVIDFGVGAELSEEAVQDAIEAALLLPLDGDVAAFTAEVERAERILYLADNAGEIAFDRLLIEMLPPGRVTLAVRGGPIINDVTREDAELVGLTDLVPVLDNGHDAPGTVLERCTPAFRTAFAEADLVIAKGQGNFESLSGAEGRICFLLRAKCPLVARLTGVPIGSQVMRLHLAAKAV